MKPVRGLPGGTSGLPRYLRQRILNSWSHAILTALRGRIPSKTIARSMFRVLDVEVMKITFDSPYYWAGWYLEGRGSVTPKSSKYLIFFRNPKDDPRLQGGYPKTASDVRKLTKSEWREWNARNRAAKKAGADPPMVVTKQVGPFKGIKPFDNLIQGALKREMDTILKRHIDTRMREIERRRAGRAAGKWKKK